MNWVILAAKRAISTGPEKFIQKHWQDLGNRAAISNQLECFGFLAIADEEPQRAIWLFGAAEALRERINSMMTDYERIEYEQAITQLRIMVAPEEFSSLWAEGRSITMEQTIELALRQ